MTVVESVEGVVMMRLVWQRKTLLLYLQSPGVSRKDVLANATASCNTATAFPSYPELTAQLVSISTSAATMFRNIVRWAWAFEMLTRSCDEVVSGPSSDWR